MQTLSVLGALLLAILMSGCLQAGPGTGPGTSEVSPMCDGARPAVAHHAGGASAEAEWVILPCLSKIGYNSREPTLGITSDGTLFHYPVMTGNNAAPMGVAVSHDGAATWDVVLPDIAGVPTHMVSIDPYFWLDPTTDRIFADDLTTPNCSMFSWSDDKGDSWDHSLSGCMETDHQTLFTGAPVTSDTIGYPNIVYRCTMNLVAVQGASTASTCQRSIDGGRTWLPPGTPAYMTPLDGSQRCDGALGHGMADVDGRVYLPKGFCGLPYLAWSDDEGITWQRSQVSDIPMPPGAHETAVAVDEAGTVYYFWVADDRLGYLAVSRDRGNTWEEPMMVTPAGMHSGSLPEMTAGGRGKIAFTYMASLSAPDADITTWDALITTSWDADSTEPTFYTAVINDPVVDAFVVGDCGTFSCGGIQDFMDIRIGPEGTPYAALIDDCLGEGYACLERDEVLDTTREGVMGWISGAPTLWGEDPNGPYP